MARITGPLFSLEARGKLGNNLIYQQTPNGSVVKRFSIPRNPNTEAQASQRSNFQACSTAWMNLGSLSRLSWDSVGPCSHVAAKNKFFSINLVRLAQSKPIMIDFNPLLDQHYDNHRFVVCRDGNDFYLRFPWSNATDLVDKVAFRSPSSTNEVSTSFQFTKLVSTDVPSVELPSAEYTSIGYAVDDDISPYNFLSSFVAGDHGWARFINSYSAAGHNLTQADIGTEWTQYGEYSNYCWLLVRIVDANNSVWLNKGGIVGGAFWTNLNIDGTLSGPYPSTSRSCVINSHTLSQIHPSTRSVSRSALMNNSSPIDSDGIFSVESIDFEEEYDILRDWGYGTGIGLYDWLRANVGNEVPLDDASIIAEATVNVRYHFTHNGACTVTQTIQHHFDTGAIDYYGYVQAYGLTKPSGGSGPFLYLNNSVGIVRNGRNYNLTETPVDISTGNPAGDLAGYQFPTASWIDAGDPPDRWVEYTKDSGGIRFAGFAIGYCPTEGDGMPEVRSTYIGAAGAVGTKLYPRCTDNGSTALPKDGGGHITISAGQIFGATTFRCPLNFSKNPEATAVSWYEVADGIIVNIDYHTTFIGLIELPATFVGKEISQLTFHPNVTIESDHVEQGGIPVTITSGGYATLLLS